MRIILILMELFANGEIDATKVLQKYEEFRQQDKEAKTRRILRNRITGREAYKIKKEKEEQQNN